MQRRRAAIGHGTRIHPDAAVHRLGHHLTDLCEGLSQNQLIGSPALQHWKRRVRASHVSVAVVQGQSIHVGGRGNWGVFLHARPESDDWQLFIVKTGADDESDDAHFADVAFGADYETACRAALFENSRPIRDAHATSYALDGDGARLLYSVLPLDGEVPADFDAALSIVRCACPDRWSDW